MAGAVVGAFASFAFVRWLAVHYRMRRASDQMLTVDVWMAIFTLSSLVTLAATYGPAAGALLEAYRIAGVACQLKNVPEEK